MNSCRIGLLVNPGQTNLPALYDQANGLAETFGFTLLTGEAPARDDVVPAFEALVAQGVDAIIVASGSQFEAGMPELAQAAGASGIPTIYQHANALDEGGLIAVGQDQIANMYLAASLVDRILKGETPGDIPIVQLEAISLGVNLSAARELGLTVPDSILARATRIVE